MKLALFFLAFLAIPSLSFGSKTIVRKLDTEEDVAVALVNYTANLSKKYIQQKGSFSVVLSGGTLIDTLRKLVEPENAKLVDWSKWLIFWVDDRNFPHDDPFSNYKLAFDGFLSKVPILERNVYAINYNRSASKVAKDYESRLKTLVEKKTIPLSTTGFPKFDLMLLGVGPDGHVASLFPNRRQRYERKRWVTYLTDAPRPPPPRITMTFPVINSSPNIAIVVTDETVAEAVAVALGALPQPQPQPTLPVAEVSATEKLTWFLNKEAASMLK